MTDQLIIMMMYRVESCKAARWAQNHLTLQNKHAQIYYLLAHFYTLSICILSRHLKLYLRKWSLFRCPWRNIHLNWSCFDQHTVACANKPCRVIYVNVKLLRSQSWVSLSFSVSWDLILDLILYNLFSILHSRRNREPRIETCNGLSTYCSVKLLTNWGFLKTHIYIYLKTIPQGCFKKACSQLDECGCSAPLD